jgi:tetratricopeptide (TPR) repeat protein
MASFFRYTTSMKRNPDDISQTFSQGLDLYFEDKYQEALEVFESLLTMPQLSNELLPQVYRRKGNCLTELGRYEEALSAFGQALQFVKKNPDIECWILESKGSCLSKMGRYKEAFDTYEKAITLVGDRDDFDYLQGEYEEMIEQFEKEKKNQNLQEDKNRFLLKMKQRRDFLENEEETNSTHPDLEGKPVLKA